MPKRKRKPAGRKLSLKIWLPYLDTNPTGGREFLRVEDNSRSKAGAKFFWRDKFIFPEPTRSSFLPFVSKEAGKRRSIPHNPGIKTLVEGLSAWSDSVEAGTLPTGFAGWHERGYLPHRDEPDLTQFVTFNLADAFPKSLRAEWSVALAVENDQEKRRQLEAYLDKGRGACHMSAPAVAEIVQAAFLHKHPARYELLAWCVMPNHVHVLFKVVETPMSVIVKEWKRYTAREANRLLGRKDRFWATDYWDTYMRDADQTRRVISYIENNPTKAGLAKIATEWRWSSAKFRNQHGDLAV
jgi:REP element-mobilizing transposase RayT